MTQKDKILLLSYIYKTLPYDYLVTAAKNDKEKKRMRTTLSNMEIHGYILKKRSKPVSFQYIILTLKGYRYIAKSILNGADKPFYSYKEGRLLLKPPSQHSFLNFAFIWHYLKLRSNKIVPETQIFEDSDINKCKVSFSYKGKDVLISPDTIIYTPDPLRSNRKKAIYVENDTGRETYKTIYQKTIEYLALAEEGMDKNKLSSISLYFIFLSQRRMKQLFLNKHGFIRFFDLYNKTNRGLEVRMRYLVKTLSSNTISIYLSYYNHENPNNPYTFAQYDLLRMLLEKEDSWKNFL